MRTRDGSTGRLLILCGGYFSFYVVTGVMVKYFLSSGPGRPGMNGAEYLVYGTAGGSTVVFAVVIALGWFRTGDGPKLHLGPLALPRELLYIIPSGLCTAVVIPTTTLMYTLPITVMVAMTLMRASVIVVSRVVDAIQIRQGILTRKVYMEENIAVVFALGAVGVHAYYGASGGSFDFLSHPAALTIFLSYIIAYAIRIYIMNYFKNTREKGPGLDNRGFFAYEQVAATVGIAAATALVVAAPGSLADSAQAQAFGDAFSNPHDDWVWAAVGGTAFGFSAFFSLAIFLYKGRTATFAGLVNRLTSLIAGTTATLLFWLVWGGRAVEQQDWIALVFILAAVGFMSAAERRRARELAAEGKL